MRLLERLQLVEEDVERAVRELRVVEDVVAVVVVLDEPAQLLDPRGGVRGGAWSSSAVWTSASGSSREQPLVRVDAAPADGDRERRPPPSRRGCRTASRRRRRRPPASRVEPPQRLEQRIRVGLVALGVLGADRRRPSSRAGPGSGRARARPCAAASRSRSRASGPRRGGRGSSSSTPANDSRLVVERLVVRAVRLDELVDPVGVEVAHLRDQARARRSPRGRAPRPARGRARSATRASSRRG